MPSTAKPIVMGSALAVCATESCKNVCRGALHRGRRTSPQLGHRTPLRPRGCRATRTRVLVDVLLSAGEVIEQLQSLQTHSAAECDTVIERRAPTCAGVTARHLDSILVLAEAGCDPLAALRKGMFVLARSPCCRRVKPKAHARALGLELWGKTSRSKLKLRQSWSSATTRRRIC